MPWEKPGASAEMMQEDSMQCRAQARAAAVRQESGEEPREAYYTTAFQQCMRDTGYSAKRQ